LTITIPLLISSCHNAQCTVCTSIVKKFNLTGSDLVNLYLDLYALSDEERFASHWNTTCLDEECECSEMNLTLTPYQEDGEMVTDIELIEECNDEVINDYDFTLYHLGDWIMNPWNSGVFPLQDPDIPGADDINYIELDIHEKRAFRKRLINESDFAVSFDKPTIIVTTSVQDDYFINWAFRTDSGYAKVEGGVLRTDIPTSLLVVTAILTVDLYYNKTHIGTYTFQINREDACSVIDCTFFCVEYLTHYLCYSLLTQVFLGISICAGLLFLCCLLFWIIYKWYQMAFLDPLFTWLGSMRAGYALTKSQYTCYPCCKIPDEEEGDDVEPLETIHDTELSSEPEIDFSRSAKAFSGMNSGERKFLACILMITLVSGVPTTYAECLATTSLSSNIVQCLTVGDTLDCSITLNTQIVLPALGTSACISFQDSVTNTSVGNVTITYKRMIRQVNTRFKYYTVDYSFQSQSKMFCPTVNDVCPDGTCKCVNVDRVNFFTGPYKTWPGWTLCESVPGCAGNGCLVCSQAEVVGRIAVAPSGAAYYVNRIEDILAVPELEVSINLGSISLTKVLTVTENFASYGNISFTFLGEISTPNQVNFGDLHVVGNSTGIWLYPVAPLGSPSLGSVGDIQAPFHEWLESTPYYVDIPENPPIYSLSENVFYVLGASSGIKLMSQSAQKFPLKFGGIMWDANPNYMTGLDPSPGAIEVFMNSPSTLKTSFKVTQVCPKIEKIYLDGCFNCQNGGSVTLLVSSLSPCDSGQVNIIYETPNRITFYQNSVFVASNSANVTLPFNSLDKQVSIKITLFYRNNNSTMKISGILDQPPPIHVNDLNWTGSELPEDTSKLSFADAWASWTGPLNVVKWTVAVVLGIVVLGIVSMVGYILVTKSIGIYQSVYHLVD
jgi:hypothetical protein